MEPVQHEAMCALMDKTGRLFSPRCWRFTERLSTSFVLVNSHKKQVLVLCRSQLWLHHSGFCPSQIEWISELVLLIPNIGPSAKGRCGIFIFRLQKLPSMGCDCLLWTKYFSGLRTEMFLPTLSMKYFYENPCYSNIIERLYSVCVAKDNSL